MRSDLLTIHLHLPATSENAMICKLHIIESTASDTEGLRRSLLAHPSRIARACEVRPYRCWISDIDGVTEEWKRLIILRGVYYIY